MGKMETRGGVLYRLCGIIFFDTTQKFLPGDNEENAFNVYVVDKKNLVGDCSRRRRNLLSVLSMSRCFVNSPSSLEIISRRRISSG